MNQDKSSQARSKDDIRSPLNDGQAYDKTNNRNQESMANPAQQHKMDGKDNQNQANKQANQQKQQYEKKDMNRKERIYGGDADREDAKRIEEMNSEGRKNLEKEKVTYDIYDQTAYKSDLNNIESNKNQGTRSNGDKNHSTGHPQDNTSYKKVQNKLFASQTPKM